MMDNQVTSAYRTIGLLSELRLTHTQPDTTAIILNWSRFSNVKRIAAVLCSPSLDSIIAEVFIWNNSPNKITHDDFHDTGCPKKLRIHNSGQNLYFQARFLACREVKTPYCFIQDDDFLVIPEAIHALHAELSSSSVPRTIHLLPAHEHLSTSLREIHVTNGPNSALAEIHTGFAWLGHGAMLHRSEAVGFLELMHTLKASEPEMKMADNYYAILGNRVPEVWFDQGMELGGGQPFTVGTEGEDRNNRHIGRAAEYLTSIAAGVFEGTNGAAGGKLPYVSYDAPGFDTSLSRAVCREARCLFETNIALLPSGLRHGGRTACDVLAIEAHNRDVLGSKATENYVNHPPSCAVDGRLETFFLSPSHAQASDFISLDFFDDVRNLGAWTTLQMVWVVDTNTERTLRSCILESSLDGVTWDKAIQKFTCRGIFVDEAPQVLFDATHQPNPLRECIFTISNDVRAAAIASESIGGGRVFRVTNTQHQEAEWKVYNVYMRGLL